MRPARILQHVQPPPVRHATTLGNERLRVFGAFAALVASGLLVTGGLLWRENERSLRERQASSIVRAR